MFICHYDQMSFVLMSRMKKEVIFLYWWPSDSMFSIFHLKSCEIMWKNVLFSSVNVRVKAMMDMKNSFHGEHIFASIMCYHWKRSWKWQYRLLFICHVRIRYMIWFILNRFDTNNSHWKEWCAKRLSSSVMIEDGIFVAMWIYTSNMIIGY